ncbi:hypothetical protein KSP39_PZI001941 [Platanthera zijinensis]|uniref:NLE domain-containing protein n=1 Tax=Platanthera zijinensis TaxID=2320716 RepID=A0AAP0BXJ0_9ASPA
MSRIWPAVDGPCPLGFPPAKRKLDAVIPPVACEKPLAASSSLSSTRRIRIFSTDMDANGTNEESSRQVRVRFVTKLQPPYKVSKGSITVPANLSRMGLSEIVNLLIKNNNTEFQHTPFDFLIDGELIRLPLEQFLLAKGISTEKILEIEYVKAVVPQKQGDPSLHDDWVDVVVLPSLPEFQIDEGTI